MANNGEETTLQKVHRAVFEDNGGPSLLSRVRTLEDDVSRLQGVQDAHIETIGKFNSWLDQQAGAAAERERADGREERKFRRSDRYIAVIGAFISAAMLWYAIQDYDRGQTVDKLVQTVTEQNKALQTIKNDSQAIRATSQEIQSTSQDIRNTSRRVERKVDNP